MALKATFTEGSDSTTVKGLYQWDYGQELEIEASDIGSEIVEIHFASSSMNEAIVRSCSFVNGIGTVTVPDACLEQSSSITAWIYQIRGTGGHTIKTITLLVTARIRPSVNRDIPATISDRYTELITQVNETVEALENGDVTVAKAIDAQNASHATSATNAGTANFATTANIAQYASSDTTKGTIEERLEIISSKDAVLYAQKSGHSDTAGHADTAGHSGTATTANSITQEVKYLTISMAQNFTPSQRVYVFTFSNDNATELVTVTLLPIASFYDNQYSTRATNGAYVMYNPNGSFKLWFFNSTGALYSPQQIFYREL